MILLNIFNRTEFTKIFLIKYSHTWYRHQVNKLTHLAKLPNEGWWVVGGSSLNEDIQLSSHHVFLIGRVQLGILHVP